MNIASFRPISALFVAVAVGMLVGPAASQGMLEGDIKIGVILPEFPAGATEQWQRELAEQVEHGAIIAEEDHAINAEMLGVNFSVVFETASGAEAAVAAAERMLERGVFGIVGGYSIDEGVALGQWASAHDIPFMNVGIQSDFLRNQCFDTTFQIEASAAMYLDAMTGWYVPDDNRRWFVVRSDDDEGQRLADRLDWSLEHKHFAVHEAGTVVLSGDISGRTLVDAFNRSGADLMVLLVSPADQLEVLGELDAAGFRGKVAAFPYPETQTREYFAALIAAAPHIDHYRILLWEPTLDTSGSVEFNARYRNRWDGETMDGPAWAAYHGVKTLFDSAFFSGSANPQDIVTYMMSPAAIFDLHKLLGAAFRPWDHQLRQPLYLVKVDPNSNSPFRMGLLVGQLPELYLPGTDPEERLDQIGDLEAQSACR